MLFKRSLILLSILLVVAMLGACVRSASTPPVSVVTPPTKESAAESAQEAPPASAGETSPETSAETPGEGAKGEPTVTNEVLQQLALFVTQTAAAAQMAGGQVPEGQQPGEAVQGGTPYPAVVEGGTPYPPSESPAAPAEGAPAGQAQPTATSQEPGSQQPTSQQPGVPQPGIQPTVTQQPAGQQPGVPQPGIQPTVTQQPGAQAPQPTAQPAPTQAAGQLVMPTSTPGIPTTYTLQPGEFVYCIARRFNVNPFELLSINGLSTSSVVRGGTTLKIPQTGHPFPGERSLAAHPTTYIVKSGENIYEIACQFGTVSPDQIAYANNLRSPYTLTAGQQLIIP